MAKTFNYNDYRIPQRFRHANVEQVSDKFAPLVRRYTQDLKARYWQRQGVLLAGTTGCGKSWTACALAAALLQHNDRRDAVYISAAQLVSRLYPEHSANEYVLFDTQETFTECMENATVLIIDDLGQELAHREKRELRLLELLRYRWLRSQQPAVTLVTSNIMLTNSPEQKNMDEALGQTLVSLLDEMCPYQTFVHDLDRRFSGKEMFFP